MGPELPMKTVAKELITGDIQFRGALSCFEPARSAIEAADYDPILLRYNPDDTYGDGANFELACTKETADRFEFEAHEAVAMEAAAAEAAAAEAAAEAERNKKPPRARAGPQTIRPWVTDGSTEAEIDAMTIKPDKEPPVVITLSRPYSEFGRPCNFGDADALDLFDSSRCEVRPKKEQLEFEVMTHLDTGVQAVPTVGEMEVQATPGPPKPMVTQTEPRLMDPEEAKAHMVNGGELATFLLRIQDDMEHMLLENSVFNYYEDELELLGQFDDEDDAAEDGGTEEIKETMSFSSLTHSKGRKASCVDWKPSDKLALAVSCVEPHSFEERVEAGGQARPGSVLVWHFTDPINPQYVLEAPVDVHSFAFNPERSDIIAGGLADGRIVIWDTRDIGEEIMAYQIRRSKGGEGAGAVGPPVCRPKQLSEAAMSHVLPVTDVKWLGPVSVSRGGEVAKAESCDFFATTSADGRVLFWPTELTKNPKTKLMEWAPSHECKMTRGEVAGILQAISLDFIDLDAGKSTFWATGMAGEVAQCDFKMREDDETVPMDASRMVSHFHEGPVRSLERSPFFPDVALSVGNWTFKLFAEGSRMPIFSAPTSDVYLSVGAFSPTRPGVVYIAKSSGEIDVWDFTSKSDKPVQTVRVCSGDIGCIRFWPRPEEKKEQLLAVGDAAGVLHVMELPRSLRRATNGEKAQMDGFLRRETDRVKDVDGRLEGREAQIEELERRMAAEEAAAAALKKEEEAAAARAEKKKSSRKVLTDEDKADEEFDKMERQFLINLGLAEPDPEDDE